MTRTNRNSNIWTNTNWKGPEKKFVSEKFLSKFFFLPGMNDLLKWGGGVINEKIYSDDQFLSFVSTTFITYIQSIELL